MGGEQLQVTAPDGRRICTELDGPEDGELVVLHVGTPGARYLYERHVEEGARRGLRHLSFSRPGTQGSDRQPGRSFADTAADTAVVADALGVERFHVVGHSVGGIAALACAALLGERVIAAAVLNSFAPRDADFDWRANAEEWNKEEFAAIEAGEEELRGFIERALASYREIEGREQLVAAFGESLSPADRASLCGDFLDFQLRGCRRVAGDGVWGWFDDDIAVWEDWGFDPGRIERPVTIWHGGDDRIVPPAHGEWLAENIPGAGFRLLPDEGHLSLWARHYGAVLDELLAV